MDCSCQPPSASPSRSSRAPASEAAAVEVIDRKRSPPRSSTPSTRNGGSGTLGFVATGARGRAADATCRAFSRRVSIPFTRACSVCRSTAKALASSASSRRVIRSSSACRAVANSAWLIGAGRRLSASACCSRSATRRPSALTCASCALLWVCSASRDRPTLLMSATALMSSSQKAAATLSQRVRELRSDGAWGKVMAASPRAGRRPARAWRCRAGWRKGRWEHRAG